MPAETRILALDWGVRRIGLALSDPLGIIATGIGTLENRPDTLAALAQLIRDRDVNLVIVGLPLTLRGAHGASAQHAMEFVESLRATVDVPVETMDERFTSAIAEQTIRSIETKRKKRRDKARVDELAAMILLQGWLDRKNRG